MNSLIQFRLLTGLSLALLASAAVGSQLSGGLSGPVLGYVVDGHEGRLRPLRGILGSATVGAPVDAGFALSQVWILDATHVMATDASPEVLVLNLDASSESSVVISGVPGNPSDAVTSFQGTSAAFYYADAHEIRIVTGLPQKPVVSHSFNLSQPGRLTHIAVSNDGALLVYSVAENDGDALYGWSASSEAARLLMSANAISAVAITGSGAAIVADGGTNEVFAIWDAGGAAVRQFLAGEQDGVSNPVGFAVSAGNRIFIANAGTDTVIGLDANGRYLNTMECNCALSGVAPLRDSVFRLRDRIHRTIFLLDASSAEERILFVPPPKD